MSEKAFYFARGVGFLAPPSRCFVARAERLCFAVAHAFCMHDVNHVSGHPHSLSDLPGTRVLVIITVSPPSWSIHLSLDNLIEKQLPSSPANLSPPSLPPTTHPPPAPNNLCGNGKTVTYGKSLFCLRGCLSVLGRTPCAVVVATCTGGTAGAHPPWRRHTSRLGAWGGCPRRRPARCRGRSS